MACKVGTNDGYTVDVRFSKRVSINAETTSKQI